MEIVSGDLKVFMGYMYSFFLLMQDIAPLM